MAKTHIAEASHDDEQRAMLSKMDERPAHETTMDELLLQAGGLGRCQLLVTAYAFVVWAVHGAQVMSMVFVGPAAAEEYASDGTAIKLSGSYFFAGWLVGLAVWGRLAARRGWMVALSAELLAAGLFGIATAFAGSGKQYLASRFLCGFAEGGVPTTIFGWAGEFLLPEHKPRCLLFLQIGFKVGSLLVTLGAYAGGHEHWRALSGAVSVAALPLAFVAALLAPESPRWLMAKGHVDEAVKVLDLVAKINGKATDDAEGAEGAGAAEGASCRSNGRATLDTPSPPGGHAARLVSFAASSRVQSSSINDAAAKDGAAKDGLLRPPKSRPSFVTLMLDEQPLRQVMLALCLHWFTYAAMFFGLSLHEASDVAETAIAVALQIPGILLTVWCFDRYGRSSTMRILLCAAALSCTAIAIESSMGTLRIRASRRFHAAFSTLGMVFMSSAFAGGYVLSSEVLPTEVRAMGLSTCSQVGRIGGFFSPMLLLLGGKGVAIPYTIWAALSFGAALATLWLPETLGEPSLETVDDLRALVTRKASWRHLR